jgi:hypothetical protein
MTQDEIIEMAKQAYENCEHIPNLKIPKEFVKVFAKLVVEKEREACAKIADEWAVGWPHPSQVIAERIRERT